MKGSLLLPVLYVENPSKQKTQKNIVLIAVQPGDDMILEVKLFPSSKEVYDNPEWFDIESSSDVLGSEAMARVLVGESSSLEDKEKLKKEYKNLYQVFDKQYKESKG